MIEQLIEKLKADFNGDIAFDAASLEKYSRDASLFKIKPEIIVFPKNVEDVKSIVKIVAEEKAAGKPYYLTARSAGTDMTGGPLGTSVIVEFTKYFSHVKKVEGNEAVTEPGVYYRDFDKATLAKGMIMPAYPASRDLCTVGGMAANNSGGEKTLLYGKVLDYVTKLKVVLRDGNEYTFAPITFQELEQKKQQQDLEGEIYRETHELIEKNYEAIMRAKPHVSKNSAGYYLWEVLNKEKGIFDLTKVIVGSQGTLGLITEITYRLVRPKTHSRLVVIFMKDMKHLGDLTNHLLEFKPESLESYDDHTFKFAAKLFPMMLKKMKGNLITLAFKFIPELWAVVTGGVPKLVLMAEFTADTDEEAYAQALKAQASLREFENVKSKVTKSAEEGKKYWTIRRESFSMLRNHVKTLRTAPFIDDFVVNPEYLPDFLPKLYAILDQYKITYTVAGHVGNGNFHIIPLMDLTKPEAKTIINELMEKVNSLVLEHKGSITGEHNDGIVRTPYIEKMFGSEIYKLFEETKKIFDPNNMFNPGKKVGGSWDYALNHLDTHYLDKVSK
ncbi:FAD-binding oxidoreductase [Candidatus Parcubacteria bacterium]|nr:FAD-binding oxidoreductase [Candidatus Parcubacteria bacterium]